MFFEDLTEYSYYQNRPLKNVFNIGWIDEKNSYAQGEIEQSFKEKLQSVIVGNKAFNAHVNKIRGIHPCNLCGADSIKLYSRTGSCVMLGSSEIWVPSKESYFAAPSMILHYIEDHNYRPPKEFIKAVLSIDLNRTYSAQNVYDDCLFTK